MPDANTFQIPPIAELLRLFVGKGEGWADPFAGWHSPAQHQNDLKPGHEGDAADFLDRFPDESLEGVILDSIRKPRQIMDSGSGQIMDAASKKIVPGGLAVCCGYNSNGLGTERGFELIHVLDVRHGGDHSDTVVTVEVKVPYQAADDPTADDLAMQRTYRQRPGRKGRSESAALSLPDKDGAACKSVDQGWIAAQIIEIHKKLDRLQHVQAAPVLPSKQKYTPAEFGAIVGRKPYTVREWCRYGRIQAEKVKGVGRGSEEEWRISHAELVRYQNDGLRAVAHWKY